MSPPLSYQAAQQYQAAGLCAIPIRLDGSKAPAVPEWTTYKNRLITTDEVADLFGKAEMGVAVICGQVSGNLETLDFETADIYYQWAELVKAVQPNLLNKLIITQTPGKFGQPGRHVRYRLKDMAVPGNMKLAMSENGKDCLIETRGEGGYALAPGSSKDAHPTKGTYTNLQGKITEVQQITSKERDVLIGCAQSLNQYISDTTSDYRPTSTGTAGDRPGDKYNQAGDFSILQKHGWKLVSQNETRCLWKRPGKDGVGISATTGYCKGKDGTPRLYVFSTNAQPFEANKYYSAFSVLALLEYEGDFGKAARALAPVTSGKVTISSNIPQELLADADEEETELFPIGLFPKRLQEVIEGIAGPLGCPTDSVGGLMLAVASIGIGYTRTILLEPEWVESASVYYVLVAYPGEGKSPILKKLAAPMYEWQRALQEQFKANLEDYHTQKEKYEADKENGIESKAPIKPKFPHVFTTDVTTEKLADILNAQPRGVGMLQDELVALIKGMNQYKAGEGRDRQFYLEAWAGGTLKVDRKKEEYPLLVHNPFITILGGIQPEMLGALRDEMGREDGFVHRFLFSCPIPRLLLPWGEKKADPNHAATWKSVFQKLTTLSQHIDSDGTMRAWVCVRTPEADAVWKQWYDQRAVKINKQERQTRAVSFKNIAYAARLSLIMQMLRWATDESQTNQAIEAESVKAGCWLADYFSTQYQLVYEKLHTKPDDVKAQELLEWIKKKGGKATVRNIRLYGPRWLRKSTEIVKWLQDLQDRGFGKYCENKPEKGGPNQQWFETGEENEL